MTCAPASHFKQCTVVNVRLTNVQHWLHFRNTRCSSTGSDIFALFGLIKRPLCENIRSTGAELAGTQKILANTLTLALNKAKARNTRPRPRPENLASRPRPRPNNPAEDIVKLLFFWSGRPIILVFLPRMPIPNFKGTPSAGAQNTWGRKAIFDWNHHLSLKRYEIDPWLLWNVNRKS